MTSTYDLEDCSNPTRTKDLTIMGKQKRKKVTPPRPEPVNSIDWESYVLERVRAGELPVRLLTNGIAPRDRRTPR